MLFLLTAASQGCCTREESFGKDNALPVCSGMSITITSRAVSQHIIMKVLSFQSTFSCSPQHTKLKCATRRSMYLFTLYSHCYRKCVKKWNTFVLSARCCFLACVQIWNMLSRNSLNRSMWRQDRVCWKNSTFNSILPMEPHAVSLCVTLSCSIREPGAMNRKPSQG